MWSPTLYVTLAEVASGSSATSLMAWHTSQVTPSPIARSPGSSLPFKGRWQRSQVAPRLGPACVRMAVKRSFDAAWAWADVFHCSCIGSWHSLQRTAGEATAKDGGLSAASAALGVAMGIAD